MLWGIRERERERTRLSKWDGRVLFQIRGKRKPMIWHQLLSFRKVEGAFSLPGGVIMGRKREAEKTTLQRSVMIYLYLSGLKSWELGIS